MPEQRFRQGMLTALGVQGLLVLLVLCIFSTPALAHRVLVFAYAEGDTIFTESKFIPNDPVRQGKILVQDATTGQTLLTGTTDEAGKFSFKIPAQAAAQKMDLKIVAEASMGHRGEWLLKAANYLSGAQAAGTPASAAATPAPATIPAPAASAPAAAKSGTVDQQALEAALNKALERQLAPINEKLTDLTIHRTTLPDILGGIGYILGLCGVGAYFMSKRQKNS
jgi:nickel transport protein